MNSINILNSGLLCTVKYQGCFIWAWLPQLQLETVQDKFVARFQHSFWRFIHVSVVTSDYKGTEQNGVPHSNLSLVMASCSLQRNWLLTTMSSERSPSWWPQSRSTYSVATALCLFQSLDCETIAMQKKIYDYGILSWSLLCTYPKV